MEKAEKCIFDAVVIFDIEIIQIQPLGNSRGQGFLVNSTKDSLSVVRQNFKRFVPLND